MKSKALVSLSLLLLSAWSLNTIAGDNSGQVHEKKVVVAMKSDDVELHEVDISHLQPGDSETVFTEDGKTIDILRTEDDVEIYIDGELLDAGQHTKDLHGGAQGDGGNVHVIKKRVEISCDEENDCDQMEWISENETVLMHGDDGLSENGQALHEDKKVYIIKKEIVTD